MVSPSAIYAGTGLGSVDRGILLIVSVCSMLHLEPLQNGPHIQDMMES